MSGERGRLHRPTRLEVCLRCGSLRGPYREFDNPCRCDDEAWDEPSPPRANDLTNNVRFCHSCVQTLVSGAAAGAPYHCRACLRPVQALNASAPRLLVPIGPHSIMNGVSYQVPPGGVIRADVEAFVGGLNGLFARQDRLFELTKQRVLGIAARLGFSGDVVDADELLDAQHRAGFPWPAASPHLVEHLGIPDAATVAAQVWRDATEAALTSSPIPVCPVCRSHAVARHVQGMNVWFVCAAAAPCSGGRDDRRAVVGVRRPESALRPVAEDGRTMAERTPLEGESGHSSGASRASASCSASPRRCRSSIRGSCSPVSRGCSASTWRTTSPASGRAPAERRPTATSSSIASRSCTSITPVGR